jgi:hypothetical protein
MADRRFRLTIAVTSSDMNKIAELIGEQYPDLAKAIKKQRMEILDSGVNVFGPYEHDDAEPTAGLSKHEISIMTGIRD